MAPPRREGCEVTSFSRRSPLRHPYGCLNGDPEKHTYIWMSVFPELLSRQVPHGTFHAELDDFLCFYEPRATRGLHEHCSWLHDHSSNTPRTWFLASRTLFVASRTQFVASTNTVRSLRTLFVAVRTLPNMVRGSTNTVRGSSNTPRTWFVGLPTRFACMHTCIHPCC